MNSRSLLHSERLRRVILALLVDVSSPLHLGTATGCFLILEI